jgi:hypothetical protein
MHAVEIVHIVRVFDFGAAVSTVAVVIGLMYHSCMAF